MWTAFLWGGFFVSSCRGGIFGYYRCTQIVSCTPYLFFLGKGFMNNLDQHKSEILSQYQQGGSILGLSKSYECNYRTMKKFLEVNGVETRGLTGNGKMEKYKDKIFELYDQGLPSYAIGKQLGFAGISIRRFLKRHGINYESRKSNKANECKDEMIKAYLDGLTSNEIADKFGLGRPFVTQYLKKLGYEFSRHLYDVDEDFFKKIDTEAKAYAAGFFWTDGCVTKNRICLKITDLDILERIREEMKYTGPLLSNRPKPTHHKLAHILSIARTSMANDLIKIGCGINKTFNLKFPSTDIVPPYLVRHFVRSAMDGDGCIFLSNKNKEINVMFVGTKEFMEGIDLFANTLGLKFRWTQRNPDKNTHHIYLTGNIRVLKFLDHIYEGATIYLERKHKIYEDFRCNYNERIKITGKYRNLKKR